MTEDSFPLEKILNVSATEYCASVGRELRDYELKGVHYECGKTDFFAENFAKVVPEEAEVVVNYRVTMAVSQYEGDDGENYGYTAFQGTGTALIFKR